LRRREKGRVGKEKPINGKPTGKVKNIGSTTFGKYSEKKQMVGGSNSLLKMKREPWNPGRDRNRGNCGLEKEKTIRN